ncbi:hypothetical protein [Cupriavidus basilensis]|uniref:hypothetical protein n=1 Tax=Cupriavidus basilensis TaxID=68895 RepID=UPI0020A696C5|nr:hypothetical protein [Cupriavidus basilensis]MCP3018522.1 hypothetical protein [Cupriavidus basilensis]
MPASSQLAFERIAQRTFDAVNRKRENREWHKAFSSFACPDQKVGEAVVHGNAFRYLAAAGQPLAHDFCRQDADQLDPHGQPRLILVLESPHKAEFAPLPGPMASSVAKGRRRIPVGPARGQSGRQIRARLHAWPLPQASLPSMVPGACFDLILVNAIRHQCSLAYTPAYYRDAVFAAAWACPTIGADHFARRLDAIWRGNGKDIVVNCCTKGAAPHAGALKDAVRAAIAKLAQPQTGRLCLVPELTHPSHWMYLPKAAPAALHRAAFTSAG